MNREEWKFEEKGECFWKSKLKDYAVGANELKLPVIKMKVAE